MTTRTGDRSGRPGRPWDDPRVARGMRAQLAWRRDRLRAGDSSLGWKVGFGAPAAMERLGLQAPLVGTLLAGTAVRPGESVSIGGWTKAVAEPEIAIHVGRDLPDETSVEEARAAILALGPAFELADVHFPPEDVEAILAGNMYQRAVVVGPASEAGAGGSVEGIVGRLYLDGREHSSTDDPEALTGKLVTLVAHVAGVLDAFGEVLRAGEVVIAGSVVPPLEVTAPAELRFELPRYGAVEVSLVP